jgi:hypothetical protein
MSQTFTDEELLTWEAFASGGRFGPRFVEVQGDEADAEALVHDSPVDRLRQLLAESRELD